MSPLTLPAVGPFQLIGPAAALTPLAAWLQQCGVAADRIAHCETLAALPPSEAADREEIIITTEPNFVPALRERPALVGGWNLPVSTVEPAPHFFWSADTSPAAAAEILRLARLARRRTEDLRTVGRRFAHDFMTPLGAVITTVGLLRDESIPLAPEDRELVESIATSSDELKQLLLRMSFLLTATTQPPPRERIDVIDALWQARDMLESRIAAARAQVTWPEQAPPVRGVTKWLLRMIEEIVDNALRHNPAGVAITVAVSTENDRVRFAFRDNGSGLDPQRPIVPFHRRTPHDGRGWGLTIVERLATLQGGRVGLLPAPAGGTVIWFELPPATDELPR